MYFKSRSSGFYFLLIFVIVLSACGDPTVTPVPTPTIAPTTTAAVVTTVAAITSAAAITTKAATTAVVATTTSATTTVAAPTTAATTGDTVKGKTVFLTQGCAACHGQLAQGDYGPKIAGTKLLFPQVLAQVRNPRNPDPAKSMTPFDEATLPDSQVADVYAYLQTLK